MKLIVAIIRPEKLNDVLESLYRAEVRGLTVSRVLGHGGDRRAGVGDEHRPGSVEVPGCLHLGPSGH